MQQSFFAHLFAHLSWLLMSSSHVFAWESVLPAVRWFYGSSKSRFSLHRMGVNFLVCLVVDLVAGSI
jgi:hypothetical protein